MMIYGPNSEAQTVYPVKNNSALKTPRSGRLLTTECNHSLGRFLAICFVLSMLTLSVRFTESPAFAWIRESQDRLFMIEGFVLDSLGARLPETAVTVTKNRVVVQTTTSNAEGRFSISGVPVGRYELNPNKPGYAAGNKDELRGSRWVTISDRSVSQVELRMSRNTVISGRVIDSRGRPVPDVSVYVSRQTFDAVGRHILEARGALSTVARTNDRGEYRILDVRPGGSYVVVADVGTTRLVESDLANSMYPGVTDISRAQMVEVNPGQELRLNDLVIQEARGVPVTLQFSPADLAGISLYEIRLDGGDSATRGRGALPNNQLVFPQVPFGRFAPFIRFVTSSGVVFGQAELQVASSPLIYQIKMERLKDVRMQLLMRNSTSPNVPVGNVGCMLRAAFGGLTTQCGLGRSGIVSLQLPAGLHYIQLDNLPADSFVAEIRDPDGKVHRDGIAVSKDGVYEIVLQNTGSRISGSVKARPDVSLADILVSLVPDEPLYSALHLHREVIADTNGFFEVVGVAAGSYRLFASSQTRNNAFKNAQFIKRMEGKGKSLTVGKSERLHVGDIAVDQ